MTALMWIIHIRWWATGISFASPSKDDEAWCLCAIDHLANGGTDALLFDCHDAGAADTLDLLPWCRLHNGGLSSKTGVCPLRVLCIDDIGIEVLKRKCDAIVSSRWCDELSVVSLVAILVVGWFGIPIVFTCGGSGVVIGYSLS
ncbi:hypothetical protein Nepgr_033741 [Nepenthes gracilis]|uniref:Uncharacterized protein n=1 Tax=Nepenthes gracilis TaxID=150966 RepID=A0AAD3TLZ5_NEPGR|nr:hypothetical protein Nepgr_033741 [Nepenthes gracilis]